jgi:hypothetical protein
MQEYSQLSDNGYMHDTINHKLYFVDHDDPLIHTKTIERFWKDLRKLLNKNDFTSIIISARKTGINTCSSKI